MKLPKFSSLYGRIFAIFWLTIFILLIAVIGLHKLDPRRSHPIEQPVIDRVNQLIDYVNEIPDDGNRLITRLNGFNAQRRDKGSFKLYLVDEEGKLLTQARGPRRYAIQSMASQQIDAKQPSQQLYGRFMVAGPFPVELSNQQWVVYAGFNTKHPPPLLYRFLDEPLQLLLLIMVISTPLLLAFAWALSQPARRLEQAARRVAHGEFKADPALERGTSEFRQAGTSFNQMVLSINQMVSGQQKLLSDISHELRSPLTRLRMANALASRKLGQSDELKRIDTEAERLEQMIRDLLDLSRMQTDSHHDRTDIDLQSAWSDILADAQFEAEQNQMVLRYDDVPMVRVLGNFKLLMSAFENIVRNAIRYGESQVEVHFTVRDQQLELTVEDNGPGVPEDELESIFRPFYRVSRARDRESGGTGLGLAITESAILQHNGTIRASVSEQLSGLKVTVSLPLQA